MADFQGFDYPESNYFRLPNNWTDITSTITSIAELKILEYVARHTWGFQEFGMRKKITTDEFIHGRKEAGGRRMDKGTGLSERAVRDGINKAVEDGYLIEKIDARDKARIKRYFTLRMKDSGGQVLPPKRQSLPPRPARSKGRSEKETLERRQGVNTVKDVDKYFQGPQGHLVQY